MSTLTPLSDECVVVRGATWATYEAVLAARGGARRPRLAYREGVLELMAPDGPTRRSPVWCPNW